MKPDMDAYLAGFFDGEGHITLSRCARRPWSIYLEIGATQTHREPLDLFAKAYGGKVYSKRPSETNYKPCWVWRCGNGKDALWALERMLPWLVVKRARAMSAVVIIRNRPLANVGGQISPHQKMAISKALKGMRINAI